MKEKLKNLTYRAARFAPAKNNEIKYRNKFIISHLAKLSITHSFFELQTLDFVWKLVWTVPTNYEIFLVRGIRRGGGLRGAKG